MDHLCSCGNVSTRFENGRFCCIQCDGLNRVSKSRGFCITLNIEIHNKVISAGDEVCYENGNCRGTVLCVDGNAAWVKSPLGSYMTVDTSKIVNAVSVDMERIDELKRGIAKTLGVSSDKLSMDIKSR